MHTFDYYYVATAMGQLEIEDIGNCAIQTCTDMGACYYMVITTNLGTTRFVQYGPIVPDIGVLPDKVEVLYKSMNWDSRKLAKEIDKFIRTGAITQAVLIDRIEALDMCKDVARYLRKYIEA